MREDGRRVDLERFPDRSRLRWRWRGARRGVVLEVQGSASLPTVRAGASELWVSMLAYAEREGRRGFDSRAAHAERRRRAIERTAA
jgi:hypothetical protein